MTATVFGGVLGRVAVGLGTAWFGWRAAIAALALLPAAAALAMRRAPGDAAAVDAHGDAHDRALEPRALVRATAAGAALFFTFVGLSTFVSLRLAEPPFGFDTTQTAAFFLLWTLGAVGPFAGRLVDRLGWERVLSLALATAMAGILISLPDRLPAVLLGLAVLTVGMFGGVTAANLGVAGSSPNGRGRASGTYFTIYYLAGGAGAFLPGFAWQAWGWPGVAGVALAVLATALAVMAVARPLAPGEAAR